MIVSTITAMRKVLLLIVAILLVGSFYAVASASAGDKKTGDTENIVIRIKGDATQEDGDGWLYIGSSGDEEKEIKIKKKERCGAYLGIYMDELSRKLKRTHDYPQEDGVIIIDVVDGSPAEEAGIEEDDIIFLFNGETVENAKQLSSLVKEKNPGDAVEVVLYRDGDEKKIEVILGEYPYEVSVDLEDFEDYAEEIGDFAGQFGRSLGLLWRDSFGAKGRLGVELVELDDDLAGYFDVKGNEGVLVLRVSEDSPAEEAGLKPGDVIVAINGEKVSDVNDILEGVDDLEEDDEIELDIVRKGKKQTLHLELEEGRHVYFIPSPRDRRIVFPPERFDEDDRIELERELDELRKELKELKKQLKELEKG